MDLGRPLVHRSSMHPIWELPLDPAGLIVELDRGSRVRIRPVRVDDRDLLESAYARLSPQSRYYRFFSPRSSLGESLIHQLTDIDHIRHLAWAVFDPDQPCDFGGSSGLGIAVARLIVDERPSSPEGASSAEAAITVVDDYHGRGIGRFLIELLAVTAADLDIDVLRFEVLRENMPMVRLMSRIGTEKHAVEGDRALVEFHLLVPPANESDLPAEAVYALLRHSRSSELTGATPTSP